MKRFKIKEFIASPFRFNFAFNIRNYVNYSRFLLIFTTLLFLVGGIIYAFFYTPQYQASAILSTRIYGSLTAMASSQPDLIPIDDKETEAPRQLVLVQSEQNLRKVIEYLHLNIKITSKSSKIPANTLQFALLEVPLALLETDFTLEVLEDQSYALKIPGENEPLKGRVGERVEVTVLQNEPFVVEVNALPQTIGAKFYVQKLPTGELIDQMLENVAIEAIGVDDKLVTNLIKLSYTGMDPKLITKTLNCLIEVSERDSKEKERRLALENLKLLEIQKEHIEDYLREKEIALGELNVNLSRLSSDDETDSKFYSSKLVEINKQFAMASADFANVKQVAKGKSPLFKQAQAVYEDYLNQQSQLEGTINEILVKSELTTALQREITAYSAVYDQLCKNCQQFHARVAEPIGNLHILETAIIPDTPITHSRAVIILLSLISGLVSGYIVALVFD